MLSQFLNGIPMAPSIPAVSVDVPKTLSKAHDRLAATYSRIMAARDELLAACAPYETPGTSPAPAEAEAMAELAERGAELLNDVAAYCQALAAYRRECAKLNEADERAASNAFQAAYNEVCERMGYQVPYMLAFGTTPGLHKLYVASLKRNATWDYEAANQYDDRAGTAKHHAAWLRERAKQLRLEAKRGRGEPVPPPAAVREPRKATYAS
jgi:hypothetical protein